MSLPDNELHRWRLGEVLRCLGKDGHGTLPDVFRGYQMNEKKSSLGLTETLLF